jgi:hypothetical protein
MDEGVGADYCLCMSKPNLALVHMWSRGTSLFGRMDQHGTEDDYPMLKAVGQKCSRKASYLSQDDWSRDLKLSRPSNAE